jgi:hypothetical protein
LAGDKSEKFSLKVVKNPTLMTESCGEIMIAINTEENKRECRNAFLLRTIFSKNKRYSIDYGYGGTVNRNYQSV